VAKYSTRFGKTIYAIHPEVMRNLELFPWPGNIRQLENVIQQAVLTCQGDEVRVEHLPQLVQTFRNEPGSPEPTQGSSPGTLEYNRETTERTAILRALEKVSFSRTRAAQLLGVSRVTLYKKMRKYKLFTKGGSYSTAQQDPLLPRGVM
jgi:transcriptional regulator with PAS, ATPase and Fis domain